MEEKPDIGKMRRPADIRVSQRLALAAILMFDVRASSRKAEQTAGDCLTCVLASWISSEDEVSCNAIVLQSTRL